MHPSHVVHHSKSQQLFTYMCIHTYIHTYISPSHFPIYIHTHTQTHIHRHSTFFYCLSFLCKATSLPILCRCKIPPWYFCKIPPWYFCKIPPWYFCKIPPWYFCKIPPWHPRGFFKIPSWHRKMTSFSIVCHFYAKQHLYLFCASARYPHGISPPAAFPELLPYYLLTGTFARELCACKTYVCVCVCIYACAFAVFPGLSP
jgi:hypothetical protein